jgi:hypothetical protein
MTAEFHPAVYTVIVKVPIATEAGWRYDAARHRLPSKLSNVIGEPGHTNPHAARAEPWRGQLWLVWGFASQYTERRAVNTSNHG